MKNRTWIAVCASMSLAAAISLWAAIKQQSSSIRSASSGTPTSSGVDAAAVRALLDKQAIQEVLARYCRGVDRADLELLRSVYHPDAIDNHGAFNGNGWEFAEGLVRRAQLALHVLGNMTIELHGDIAYVETYFVSHTPGRQDGKPTHLTFGGRYVDRFERRNAEWRIAHRTLVHDFSRFEIDGKLVPWPNAPRITQGVTGKTG